MIMNLIFDTRHKRYSYHSEKALTEEIPKLQRSHTVKAITNQSINILTIENWQLKCENLNLKTGKNLYLF
jgi:hypothetical protein